MKDFKIFLSLLTPRQRKKFFIFSSGGVIISFFELIGLGGIFYLMTIILDFEKIHNHKLILFIKSFFGVEEQFSIILLASIIVGVIYILKTFGILYFYKKQIRHDEKLHYYISKKLFETYLSYQYKFFIQRNTSDILKVMNNHTTELIYYYIRPLSNTFINLIILLLVGSSVIYLDPLIFTVFFIIISLVSYLFIKLTNKRSNKSSIANSYLNTKKTKITVETFNLIKEIKLLIQQKIFKTKYNSYLEKNTENTSYHLFIKLIPKYLLELIIVINVLALIITLLYFGQSPEIILTKLSVLGVAAFRLIPLISRLNEGLADLRYGRVALNKIYDDINLNEKEVANGTHIVKFKNEIKVKNIGFKFHNHDKQILKNITVKIEKNKSIALVGESGGGKSTLLNIILGLLKPNQGQVLLDGIDIKKYKDYSKIFGYIPQQIYLSDTTIAKNIALGYNAKDIDTNRLKEVIKQVELQNIINKLPDAEHTIIGENGVRLSGGQRQRIGIARALYHNPQVLIMDEATSALDNITEQKIIETLKSLKDKAIIFVAHRLSTIEHCDNIYVMKDGIIDGEGTYKQLLSSNENFKNLVNKNV